MSKMKKVDWIIAYDGTKGDEAYMLKCLRCGAKQKFMLPVSIDYYLDIAKAFEREHKRCKEK